MLRRKYQIVLPPSAFEQILEGFAEDTFPAATRYCTLTVQFSAIFVDDLTAHPRIIAEPRGGGKPADGIFRQRRNLRPAHRRYWTESWQLRLGKMERVKGIEPSYSAWEAAALPLSYTRLGGAAFGTGGRSRSTALVNLASQLWRSTLPVIRTGAG